MRVKDDLRRGLSLFWAFFRVGAFTFGGGYAMLPLLEAEVVTAKGWAGRDEVMDDYALAQSLPGVIAVNTSLLLGYRLAGVFGAVMAGLGVILPSILVITGVAVFFAKFMENPVVARVFQGVRAGVVGLIFVAALRFAKGSILNVWHLLIAGIALAVATFTNLHILVLLLFGGLAGWFIPRGTEHGYVDPTGGGDKL
ncbi:MAG TPA: chromate transporter [Firmicutes bacterium]|jgi:chromate transporter|nr:chromate transporter [Bacillota bacterium]HOQ23460.1 chromate transporter [Bacillota bacterium]HPT67868.1 chromate transporter [Bacillota bacterium]